MHQLHQWLAVCIASQASDLHLSTGLPPLMRVHGEIRRLSETVLESEVIQAMLHSVMSDTLCKEFAQAWEVDFSCDIPPLGRFRVNAFHQTRGVAAVVRLIPTHIPSLLDIQAPAIVTTLLGQSSGLILVTGPTGSGKSTTLAAMDHINSHIGGHILTVEDPVEFVHTPLLGLVNQREVGTHTHSFANALRSALREDPDVILVGELRDLETIRLALTAAETGHLVLATVHTSSAAKTVDRLIDVFPGDEKNMARAMLSESLLAVISQTLCQRQDGQGALDRRPQPRPERHRTRRPRADQGRDRPRDFRTHRRGSINDSDPPVLGRKGTASEGRHSPPRPRAPQAQPLRDPRV